MKRYIENETSDSLVNKIVKEIARVVAPDRIILFGSRAQGSARKESDVDLLLVYSGTKSKREIKLTIYNLFPHPDFSIDLFVMSPEELNQQKGIANTLAREVSEKGVVCYG
ncbi:MAG: nucleotidyltransferase domain-containing protein [Nitrospirae bacterium]|nr:nucleotidyltransferase domain-containing protein [Candidatus Troglogloeales bacterium]